MLFLSILSACGWWEGYQACSAATDAAEAAWTELQTSLGPAAELARIHASATAAAADAVESAVGAASTTKPEAPSQSRAQAAQDAFTRASRVGGTADGASEARWVDWAARTYEQAAEAERRAELTTRVGELLELRSRARSDADLSFLLALLRYESIVRAGEARSTLGLDASILRTPAPADEPQLGASELAALETAFAFRAAQTAAVDASLATASTAAYEADREGQRAKSTGDGYAFLGFPATAKTAQAASFAALSAATRATAGATGLREEVERRKQQASEPPTVDASVQLTLQNATDAASAALRACE